MEAINFSPKENTKLIPHCQSFTIEDDLFTALVEADGIRFFRPEHEFFLPWEQVYAAGYMYAVQMGKVQR